MLTKAFWLAALERAVRTFAQALIAVFATTQTGLLDVDWPGALSAAGMAAVLSILTSVAASKNGSPSLANEIAKPLGRPRDAHGRFVKD